jgi:hypothetical protein
MFVTGILEEGNIVRYIGERLPLFNKYGIVLKKEKDVILVDFGPMDDEYLVVHCRSSELVKIEKETLNEI